MKTPNEIAEEFLNWLNSKDGHVEGNGKLGESASLKFISLIEQAITTYAEEKVNEQREILAKWMISRSLSTGHGDTIEDLLKELDWQLLELREIRAYTREIRSCTIEECAEIAKNYPVSGYPDQFGIAQAILNSKDSK